MASYLPLERAKGRALGCKDEGIKGGIQGVQQLTHLGLVTDFKGFVVKLGLWAPV
jgi:hypothetical protein